MIESTTGEPPLSQDEADLAAVAGVRQAGFRGPIFESFIDDLYLYAWKVMLSAIRTGSIVSIKTGLPSRSIPADERQVLHDSSQEREDLAHDSIARAMPKFIASLKSGRWDPSKGRSLRSFLVGACAYAFWQEYDLWKAQRRRRLAALERLANIEGEQCGHPDDLEERHDCRQAVRLLLERARNKSPELEAILRCLLAGMTAAEAAGELGYSERALEGRMYQFRKTAWGLVRSGRIDPSLVPGSRARLARELEGAGR
jgi:DNA-directed RNA polymerase specialized sigma24 family protein